MSSIRIGALGCALAALVFAYPWVANAESTNVDTEAKATSPAAQAVERSMLAERLVEFGIKNKDPMALILAARIKKGIVTETAKREKTSMADGAAPSSAPQKTERDVPDAPSEILAKAREFAAGDKRLLSMISDAQETSMRGAVGGPIRHYDRVNARTVDNYRIAFRGREPAVVGVRGDGDTDLDLYIYDQNGNRICTDDDYTDVMICRWTPAWTGTFLVRVRNRGNVYNRYMLLTN